VSRRFTSRRRISLSDTDAVARYLQDVASEDWLDAGFDHDSHVWVVRRTELEVQEPFRPEDEIELATWCSGVAGSSAARRYSIAGRKGGRVEAESIWIHLDHDLRPKRLDARFHETYGVSASGRRAPTRFTLPGPDTLEGRPWAFRATDIDRLGHVNNAAYWVPLDTAWAEARVAVQRHRFGAILEYRQPIDLDEPVTLVEDGSSIWLVVDREVRAAAALDEAVE
jgi:acyl-ACP thioesterase